MRKILTAALLLLGITAFAQQHSVKGTVTDQNGYPVIGMAVQEQGTSNGVVTDENGEYSITVASPQASLEFNSLGYETVIEQDCDCLAAGMSVLHVDLAGHTCDAAGSCLN